MLCSHHPLGQADRNAVLALPYRLRRMEPLSHAVREGERPTRCTVLLSGYAFRHKLTGDGSRQILAIGIPGDALDFQHLFFEEADHNVQMLTKGLVAEIPMASIEELIASNAQVARAVFVSTLVEASTFREWTVNVGRRDGRSRVAHLLCEFAYPLDMHELSVDGNYELPMTQEQLADATGLTSVHVNRVLQGLQREKLIDRDRRVIRFLDRERLQDVADFNPRYLHPSEMLAPA
jgi:CRP-like cAMP-binding protein